MRFNTLNIIISVRFDAVVPAQSWQGFGLWIDYLVAKR
jgi:hypothetical protein